MSTLTPSAGYSTIEEEFEARLRDAFVEKKADVVFIYSRRDTFHLECAWWAQAKGWLDTGNINQLDEQSSRAEFRLTEEGKRHFGIL